MSVKYSEKYQYKVYCEDISIKVFSEDYHYVSVIYRWLDIRPICIVEIFPGPNNAS